MVGVAITVVCSVPLHVREEWSSTGEEVAEHVLSLICTDSIAELIELLSAMSLGSLELILFLSVDLKNFMIPTASESSFFLFPDIIKQ